MATPWKQRESMPMLVTQAIFGINVAVFIGMLLSGASPMQPASADLLAWGANAGPYTLTGDWWRLVTSCFVHGGIIHLAFNMWCLWSLGEMAERLYGRVTFAFVYLLCGIGGSLASVWWHNPPTVSVGASGAIFGIAGAVIASLKLGEFSGSAMTQGTMQSLIVFVGYNVVFGAISGRSDNACHFGGLIAGLIMGALIAKVAPEPKLAPRVGVLVLVAAILAGGLFGLERSRAFPYYMMRASEQVENGKVDAAIELYNSAIKLRPDSASQIHGALARLYSEKQDFASAERELQKTNLTDERTLYWLGVFRLKQHHMDDSQQTFMQLLALNPQSGLAHMGLGMAADEQGNFKLALQEYGKAAQANPQLAFVYIKQGNSLMQLKQYDEAITSFRKEIEISGDDESTERALAEAYKAKGMSAEADAALQQAEKIKSGQE